MPIFRIVGILLLILSGLSGVALFFRAVFGAKDHSDNTPTLWGLFLCGLIFGLIIIAAWGR